MISWILSMILMASTGAGMGDCLRDQDRDQLQEPIKQQLRDGSCQTASVISLANLNG